MEKTNKVLVVLLIIALILVGFFGYLSNKYLRRLLSANKIHYMTLKAIDNAGYDLTTKKEYNISREAFEATHKDTNFDESKEMYELVKKYNKENTKDNMVNENN